MLPGLINPMGGYDYGAIEAVFSLNQIALDARQNMLPTILKLIEVLEKARSERRAKQ